MNRDGEYDDAALDALLRTLDHDPSDITAGDVIGRARRRSGLRAAAAVVLTVGIAGAAYALPGSPVRDWVHAALDRPASEQSAGEPVREAGGTAGITLDPDKPIVVSFTAPLRGHLAIALADTGRVVGGVRSGRVRFTAEPDRLRVEMLAPDTFELMVPRATRRVEVRAAGRLLFLKDGARISAPVGPDPDGHFHFRLAPDRP